ncbi:precorrin-2/cobalt-factor-2 C20-methyltransferase [Desulfarculales bacterium]
MLAVLDSGRDAAFVTIGDPLTYSTYAYLLRTLKEMAPKAKVETVPGITAYHAAAARLNLPLVESKQSLLVVSGVSYPADIPRLAACGDTVVIMKTYRNFDRILDALEELPGTRSTYSVSQCGLAGEHIQEDATCLRGQKMPYLSLMIVKGSTQGWTTKMRPAVRAPRPPPLRISRLKQPATAGGASGPPGRGLWIALGALVLAGSVYLALAPALSPDLAQPGLWWDKLLRPC